MQKKRLHPDRNVYVSDGDLTTLTIRRMDGTEHQVLLDTADRKRAERYICGTKRDAHTIGGIFVETGWPQPVLFHRYIKRTPAHQECRSINGNFLDCRKRNLRNGSHWDTMRFSKWATQPKSGHRYVVWHQVSGFWRVQFSRGGKGVYIGRFTSIPDAVEARDRFLQENPQWAA